MSYVTAVRGHDAEWLLQQELRFNDVLLRQGRRRMRKKTAKLKDTSKLLLEYTTAEPTQAEKDAVRRLVMARAASRGAAAVQEILDMLGLGAEEQRRICQGCKSSVPPSSLQDRGDGERRCLSCRERHPARMLPAGVKRCTRCKVAKPFSEYHRHSRTGDGLHSRCKGCRALEERKRAGRRLRAAS